MRRKYWAAVMGAAAFLLAGSVSARAQSGDLQTLLGNQAALKLKDLEGGGWQRVKIISANPKADSAGGLGGLLGPFGGGGDAALGPLMGDLFESILSGFAGPGREVYFTKGQTVTIGGEVFLLAYQPRAAGNALFALYQLTKDSGLNAKPPNPKAMTGETPLGIALVNMKTIGSLTEARPFRLATEIAESEELAKVLAEISKDSGSGIPPGATGEGVAVMAPDASDENMRTLGFALAEYARNNNDKLPPMASAAAAKKALLPYVLNDGAFVHPETREAHLPNPALSGKRLRDMQPYAPFMVAFYEAQGGGDGTRRVLFLNQTVRRVSEAEWRRLKKASKIP